MMGPDAMIFVFWMLSFKPTFSLSTFTLCLWPHLKCFDFCWESALLLLLWTNPPQGLFPPSSPLIGNRCSQSWSWAFHFSHSILYSRKAHYWNFPGVQWLRLCTPNNWHSQVKKKEENNFSKLKGKKKSTLLKSPTPEWTIACAGGSVKNKTTYLSWQSNLASWLQLLQLQKNC